MGVIIIIILKRWKSMYPLTLQNCKKGNASLFEYGKDPIQNHVGTELKLLVG